MQQAKPSFGIKFLLFMFFLMGLLITAFVIVDGEYTHWWIHPPQSNTHPTEPQPTQEVKSSPANTSTFDRLRQSIVLVESRDCAYENSGGTGTGFVVQQDGQTRYLATNAHVIKRSADCDRITVVDHTGKRHHAQVAGISREEDIGNDLAVLKLDNIESNALPPLALLNSTQYKTDQDGKKVITIGYPVPGLASTYDKASISGEGRISQYENTKNYYITSGLATNPGNSGGPVFNVETNKVVGIVVAKARAQDAENVGMIIPIARFKEFFKEKTGRTLQ